jgi:hypothetical protein
LAVGRYDGGNMATMRLRQRKRRHIPVSKAEGFFGEVSDEVGYTEVVGEMHVGLCCNCSSKDTAIPESK